MMSKRIRSMIDEIFSEMKMTAENLALRDELMANAQARYEDALAQGKSEEEAFKEVAASLGDVHALLSEMNAQPEEKAKATDRIDVDDNDDNDDNDDDDDDDDGDDDGGAPDEGAAQDAQPKQEVDLGEELNKAFTALGELGRSFMPQAKKLVRQVDDATGGVILDFGRAVNKGMKDAQKAANEAIDRFSGEKGEITIDFGKREEKPQQAAQPKQTPQELREEAKDLRAQAGFKQVSGDAEGAQALNAQADALETQADALEQAQAMEQAQREAQGDAIQLEEKAEPVIDEAGEVNEDAFTRVVDQIEADVNKAGGAPAQDADYAPKEATGRTRFPAAGLRGVDIQLDADDVRIVEGEGDTIETVWEAQNVDGEPVVTMEGHTLTIRRKNPDVFKTFFSVFSKAGGEITVRVPHGYGADYRITTTSGDVRLSEVDVETVEVSTTSGDVRVEPDAQKRAQTVKVSTVSGDVTVSAIAGDVIVNTVSGDQFVSCDANKVDVNAVSGDVHVEGACEEWSADAVSGDIELLCTVAPTRKIDLNTMSGSARVALPADIRGFVADLSGMSGHITNEFGPNRYGTCALPIHMDTMSGSLLITRL